MRNWINTDVILTISLLLLDVEPKNVACAMTNLNELGLFDLKDKDI